MTRCHGDMFLPQIMDRALHQGACCNVGHECHVIVHEAPDIVASCLAVGTPLNDIWVQQAGPGKWPFMKCLTQTATLLLMREPPPSDPLQARLTPTPAHWDSLRVALKQVVAVQEFFVGVDVTDTDVLALRSDLMKMPYYMLAGHLPDLKLDVTNVIR